MASAEGPKAPRGGAGAGAVRSLTIEPAPSAWCSRLGEGADQPLDGAPLRLWRRRVRGEVGLGAGGPDDDRPVVATGHQALLWHPGILAKYLAVESFAARSGAARAHLVVDQHVEGFGSFEAPIRRSDGTLSAMRLRLTAERRGVPMALHEPFAPPRPPERWPAALPCVARGTAAIFEAVTAHRHAPNAALQLQGALADLMRPWVPQTPAVTASSLLETGLGRLILERMAGAPEACAAAYNRAVSAVPEAGIAPLHVRDDWIEMPLWRLRPTGERMRAWDHDVQRRLDDPATAPRLLPRALLLTALVRLGLCDLFVHGTGGAAYDRAMEIWVERWLGVRPAPAVVVSATVCLPLARHGTGAGADGHEPPELDMASIAARRAWHDPEALTHAHRLDPGPGRVKRELLARVQAAPRRSRARRDRWRDMHRGLAGLREDNRALVDAAGRALERARRDVAERAVVDRRTWPFPLYPAADTDRLAALIHRRFTA